jgi:phosphoglycerate dehydrogenase-like enzyme
LPNNADVAAAPIVAIYRPVAGSEASHDAIRAAGCELLIEPFDQTGELSDARLRDAHVVMGATFRGGIMDESWFDKFPQLRLVSKYTIGYDDIDLDAATARGIAVTHCPTEANWGGVAEGAIAMLLALCKRVRERDAAVKSGGWRDPALEGHYLGAREDGYAGLVVGIVGLGRAGRRVAELLQPWHVRLLACDPYVSDEEFALRNVERVDLRNLLQSADAVSLHCNLTPETRDMIDAQRLAWMKPGSILINTARGRIVDLDALLEGLEQGRPAQAALDVFPEEPVPDAARLRALGDRLLLSPHMVAANEGGTLQAAIPWATQAVFDALAGVFPARVVNPAVEKRWRTRFTDRALIEHRSYVQD